MTPSSQNKNIIRILIAAAGSGGHIFPALYIAQAFKEIAQNTPNLSLQIEFIGSGRPLEKDLIEGSGFERHVIPMVGIQKKGLLNIFNFFMHLPTAGFKTWKLLSHLKPSVIIGVGGYVTFFPVALGALRGIPTWIHEAELKPGIANLVLSFFAKKISVAFTEAKIPFPSKVVVTGHPVRGGLDRASVLSDFEQGPRRVLILGGSQGAKNIDEAMLNLASFFKERSLEIWHQCRPESIPILEECYSRNHVSAKVSPFIHDMQEAYAWGHIIISRAGAGTTSEIGVVNKPSIFVPYPYAQGGHQKSNAMVLVNKGKALLVEEKEDFANKVRVALEQLLDLTYYQTMRARPTEAAFDNAAHAIARGCLKITGFDY